MAEAECCRPGRRYNRSMRHGARSDPPNRFESIHIDWDETSEPSSSRDIVYLEDASQSIVSENRSPDLSFRYSVNPYRGCAHGCAYCYARPTHEYLGLGAGIDFETKIVVKRDAPRLFREFLAKDSWKPEPIAFSGVTDCYQPIERSLELTRGCLTVAAESKQPLSIVTKNALVCRDVDLLSQLAHDGLVHVYVSITTLDPELARDMEPRTSTPSARLRAIETLAAAGVPAGVMVAPVIPGLNDHEMPTILKAARDAGASVAGYVLLRLPLSVEPVFSDWLERTRPRQSAKIMGRVRSTRGGKSNESTFGTRMTGSGEIAEQIGAMFRVLRHQLSYRSKLAPHRCDLFRRPPGSSEQLRLF